MKGDRHCLTWATDRGGKTVDLFLLSLSLACVILSPAFSDSFIDQLEVIAGPRGRLGDIFSSQPSNRARRAHNVKAWGNKNYQTPKYGTVGLTIAGENERVANGRMSVRWQTSKPTNDGLMTVRTAWLIKFMLRWATIERRRLFSVFATLHTQVPPVNQKADHDSSPCRSFPVRPETIEAARSVR